MVCCCCCLLSAELVIDLREELTQRCRESCRRAIWRGMPYTGPTSSKRKERSETLQEASSAISSYIMLRSDLQSTQSKLKKMGMDFIVSWQWQTHDGTFTNYGPTMSQRRASRSQRRFARNIAPWVVHSFWLTAHAG